ncbi:MAG: hypothetical protein JW891_04565 [Candidatus Lokiarchaeota archaeon]|nr:hypothetical protein [Candidatus Lokiarchaeota archaeon]
MILFLLNLPVTIVCFTLSAAIFIHVKRTWVQKNKDPYKKLNEIVNGLFCALLGILYHLYVLKFGNNLTGIARSSLTLELALNGMVGILSVMFVMSIWALSQKIKTIKNPELLQNVNNYELFCERLKLQYKPSVKRKFTHLLPLAVVSGIVMVFWILNNNPVYSYQGRWKHYALFFVVIFGMDFALTFLIGDLIRLFDYSYMPRIVGELYARGLTPTELDTFSSTSIMVFGFAPFLLFDFPLFFIILLIASVADGMASIFGIIAKKIGFSHEFPKGSTKTIEGYIGGSFFAFLCTLFGGFFSNTFGFSNPSVWSLEILLSLGTILSVVVFLVDIATSTKIRASDNYLNPLACGIVAIIYLYLIGVPF